VGGRDVGCWVTVPHGGGKRCVWACWGVGHDAEARGEGREARGERVRGIGDELGAATAASGVCVCFVCVCFVCVCVFCVCVFCVCVCVCACVCKSSCGLLVCACVHACSRHTRLELGR